MHLVVSADRAQEVWSNHTGGKALMSALYVVQYATVVDCLARRSWDLLQL